MLTPASGIVRTPETPKLTCKHCGAQMFTRSMWPDPVVEHYCRCQFASAPKPVVTSTINNWTR